MNRSLQIRAGIVILVLLLSLWGLIPSIRLAMVSPQEREKAKTDPAVAEEIGKLQRGAIRKGLDLQGGMYIVLEVDQTGMTTEQARDALSRVREIITNRVDQFGISEPVVQTQGRNRIIVQLPGLQDVERAKNLIGSTAQLEFRLVRPADEIEPVLDRLDEAFRVAAGQAPADTAAAATTAAKADDSAAPAAPADSSLARADSLPGLGELPPLPTQNQGELTAEDPWVKEHPFSAYVINDPRLGQTYGTPLFVEEPELAHVQQMLQSPAMRALPRDVEMQLGRDWLNVQGGQRLRALYLLNATPNLTGERLNSARSAPDPQRPGGWEVNMGLDRMGASQFRKVTGENVGRYLAISLDGRVASAPVIRNRIPNGQATISGTFTSEEAADLALLLRAGALPAKVNIEMERSVGPSLGRDSIRKGVRSALVGAGLVILFVILYYRVTGFIVAAALISNVIILLAVLAKFGLVLTLPGIAGIILTVGMAVDANVLINERIREELRKSKTVRASVEAGFQNATRTIIDANVTTLIAGVILLWFGTGPIKGFAVTLSVGILTSMFTALVMTRVIMDVMTRGRVLERLSI